MFILRFRRVLSGVLAAAVLLAVACRVSRTPPDPEARLRRNMARADRLVLEVQRAAAGEAPDAAAVRERLDAIARLLDGAADLHPFHEASAADVLFAGRARTATTVLRGLAADPWTADNRGERFAALKGACATCHEKDFIDTRLLSAIHGAAGDADPVAAAAARPSREACGTCHAEVLSEWAETLHARAWTDPLYRRSFPGGEPDVMCRSCHSMKPILAGEISTATDWRPAYRDRNREDGISCAACHLRADGTVAAAADHPDAPCRPRRDARLTTPEFCGACHNPTHGAYDEWASSRAAKEGTACGDCHTQKVARTGADGRPKTGVSHRWRGGFDGEFVKKAIRAGAGIEGDEVVMRVDNRSSHKFPGEVPTRSFILRVRTEDAAGAQIDERDFTFRRPFKTEVGAPDNRLLPDETRTVRCPLPAAARRVHVGFLFRPSPFAPEDAWFTLHEWDGERRK